MVDAVVVVTLALLVGGVLGTLVPLVPGGLLSLSGIVFYWWQSGFAEPGPLAMVIFGTLCVLTLFAEFFGGAISARVGGASWRTTAVAAAVGVALLVVTGPLGLLVGLFGTVFVLELARDGDVDGSVRSAVYATAGILVSTAVQVTLTTTVLVGFLLVVLLL
ncbi:DUF456 domain-containing protein [Natrialbaceae archaeon AArc-T1-2]|uniref:DUF456 domain-containing protein n=1 Tax=Natrialbaceae archaeon AArc-T1-2 TaxID=3053904 RepID=UPI00255B0CA3|nr:DUF456 domain-containing protein [Natrialbaceae archaeon AArc-T1-2]WIV67698.1 DUF456 domain-containing protein [Natrialbaceae archaeon AArc-T1-2]